MPEIRENSGIVTQITTVKLPPDNEKEVLDLMAERARFMAKQPGFVSVSLHRSQDQPRGELRPVDQPREARGRAPLARVPHEMAAPRRASEGDRALPL